MPRISDIAVFALPDRHTLSIRGHCASPGQFPAFIGGSFQKLGPYLDGLGELMTDLPYVLYEEGSGDGFTLEVGFTVPRALPGIDDIRAGLFPACKAAVCMHLGPYDGLAHTYDEMLSWSAERGLSKKGPFIENYYNGPSTPPEHFLTRIILPLE